MAAFAEGFNVLAKADIGPTTILPTPRRHRWRMPSTTATTSTWRRSPRCGGAAAWSSSWLLDLTAEALVDDPKLEQYSGNVSDSGEGRWTIHAAVDEGVPAPVLSAALYARFSSRGRADVADKILSAMRRGFGGHHERKTSSR